VGHGKKGRANDDDYDIKGLDPDEIPSFFRLNLARFNRRPPAKIAGALPDPRSVGYNAEFIECVSLRLL